MTRLNERRRRRHEKGDPDEGRVPSRLRIRYDCNLKCSDQASTFMCPGAFCTPSLHCPAILSESTTCTLDRTNVRSSTHTQHPAKPAFITKNASPNRNAASVSGSVCASLSNGFVSKRSMRKTNKNKTHQQQCRFRTHAMR